ncbi:serine/threonine-protein kinase [Acanthopleuribacter pedis]|uniref:Serine/threonine protein kinase n=1 Tax=Acanthopleuribacter pedis TaxID=442870 RepID=A0A8J7QHP3_9BACT|nr:serine/threonine-protein kinase [Acanthopleuribacter pedis]MBO1318700.1 serine/threonine protein kinase [Acanthopleuribacter pedis]
MLRPVLFERTCKLVFDSGMPANYLENSRLPEVLDADFFDAYFKNQPVRVGPYRVIRELGRGAMGSVFQVRQIASPNQDYALKLWTPNLDASGLPADEDRFLKRFQREVAVLRALKHPNVVAIHDHDVFEGRPYLVMDYVPGQHIDDFVVEKQLSLETRLQLFIQVCLGVEHIHEKGCLHRDLKPSNILAGYLGRKAHAWIVDLGIAKNLAAPMTLDHEDTLPGHRPGTPLYMAPEQLVFGGGDDHVRADIYALGCLLYVLWCDQKPYARFKPEELTPVELKEVLLREPMILPDQHGGLQGASAYGPTRTYVQAVIQRATEKSFEKRYPSVAALRMDCEAVLKGAFPAGCLSEQMPALVVPALPVGRPGGSLLVMRHLMPSPRSESFGYRMEGAHDPVGALLLSRFRERKGACLQDQADFLLELDTLGRQPVGAALSPMLVACYREVAEGYLALGRVNGALRQFEALEARARTLLGPSAADCLYGQITIAWEIGRNHRRQAEKCFEKLRHRVRLEEYPELYVQIELWFIHQAARVGAPRRALERARVLSAACSAHQADWPAGLLTAERTVAFCLWQAGCFDQAEAVYRRLVDALPEDTPDDPRHRMIAARDYGFFLIEQNRPHDARERLLRALAWAEVGDQALMRLSLRLRVGLCLADWQLGRFEAVCTAYQTILAPLRAAFGGDDSEVKRMIELHALALAHQGCYEAALCGLDELLDREGGADQLSEDQCRYYLNKMNILLRQGKLELAEAVLEGPLAGFETRFRDAAFLLTGGRLIKLELLVSCNRHEEALELADLMLAEHADETVQAQIFLFKGAALARCKRLAEAKALLLKSRRHLREDPWLGRVLNEEMIGVLAALEAPSGED